MKKPYSRNENRMRKKIIRKDLGNPSLLRHNAFLEKIRIWKILNNMQKQSI